MALDVVSAWIVKPQPPQTSVVLDTQILVQRRPLGKEFSGAWETPGGKVEEGESFKEALRREFLEELGVELNVSDMKPFKEYYLGPPLVKTPCILHFIQVCLPENYVLIPREAQPEVRFRSLGDLFAEGNVSSQIVTPGTFLAVRDALWDDLYGKNQK